MAIVNGVITWKNIFEDAILSLFFGHYLDPLSYYPHLIEHVTSDENEGHSRQEQYPELIVCDPVGGACDK